MLGFISYFGVYMLFWGLEQFWNLQVVTDFVRHFAKMDL